MFSPKSSWNKMELNGNRMAKISHIIRLILDIKVKTLVKTTIKNSLSFLSNTHLSMKMIQYILPFVPHIHTQSF